MGAADSDLRSGGLLVHDVQIVRVPAARQCIEGYLCHPANQETLKAALRMCSIV